MQDERVTCGVQVRVSTMVGGGVGVGGGDGGGGGRILPYFVGGMKVSK